MQQARGGALPAAPPRVRVAKLLRKRSRADLPLLLVLRWENRQYLAVSLLQTPQWWPPAGSPCLLLHPVQAAPEVRAWLTWLPSLHFPVLTESPSSIRNISHISHLPYSLQSNLCAPLRSPERWDPFLCLFPWLPRSQQSCVALWAHRRQSQARSAFQLFAGVGASLSVSFPPSLSLCTMQSLSSRPSSLLKCSLWAYVSLCLSMPDSPATPGEPSFFTCPRSYWAYRPLKTPGYSNNLPFTSEIHQIVFSPIFPPSWGVRRLVPLWDTPPTPPRTPSLPHLAPGSTRAAQKTLRSGYSSPLSGLKSERKCLATSSW